MKTGIIRRLDDLGRIVIPKEIRRSLQLGENDPLEISIEDKKLVLEPYSKLSEAELTLEPCMNAFRKYQGISLAVTTKNEIVSTIYVSTPKGTPLTDELAGIISGGKEYIADDAPVFLTDMCRKTVSAVFPVMTGSDCFGAVVLINSNGEKLTDEQIICGRFLAQIVSEVAGEL